MVYILINKFIDTLVKINFNEKPSLLNNIFKFIFHLHISKESNPERTLTQDEGLNYRISSRRGPVEEYNEHQKRSLTIAEKEILRKWLHIKSACVCGPSRTKQMNENSDVLRRSAGCRICWSPDDEGNTPSTANKAWRGKRNMENQQKPEAIEIHIDGPPKWYRLI